MRIAIDCRIYGPAHGSIGRYMEYFVSFLEKNNDGNEYVLFFNEREFGEFSSTSAFLRPVKVNSKIGTLADQLLFWYALRKQQPDIVLFPHPYSPIFSFRKSIVLLSDLVPYFYPDKHLKRSLARYWHHFLLRNGIKKAYCIIALSETLKRDIIEVFDKPEEKIHVAHPMVLDVPQDKTSWETEGKQFLLHEGIKGEYMLFVWDLKEHRNIPRLLEAYRLLVEEDENTPDLVLVGREDPSYHRIRSTLIQLKLQSRVHIYNILEDEKIDFLYRHASLYVVPSLYEGSEEAILSPLAYSLPIAASAIPSITSVLSKDEAAFFRPMSIFEMKETLKQALSDSGADQREKKDLSKYAVPTICSELLSILALCAEGSER